MVMAAVEEEVSRSRYEVELPGFRFHPTEEELLSFYLKGMVLGNKFRCCCDIIGFLNIYNYDPRDLPGLAKIGEREWYFFVPRDRKHGSGGGGGRPNRTTETGFWKATGSDRKILSTSDPKKLLGLKKTLVFYQGRAPHGTKTNWVMNEYRLPDKDIKSLGSPKDIVLCKIYMKATSLKVLEQRAAMELLQEDSSANTGTSSPSPSPPISSFTTQFDDPQTQSYSSYDNNIMGMGMGMGMGIGMLKKESEEDTTAAAATTLMTSYEKYDNCCVKENSNGGKGRTRSSSGGLMLPGPASGTERLNMAELQVQVPNFMDSQSLSQDSFWSQLSPSPWLENLTLTPAYMPMC